MSRAVRSDLRTRAISIHWTSTLSCPDLFWWERDMTPEARASVELRRSPRRQGARDSITHSYCSPGFAPSAIFMLSVTPDRVGFGLWHGTQETRSQHGPGEPARFHPEPR